jgi:hypothetical protein
MNFLKFALKRLFELSNLEVRRVAEVPASTSADPVTYQYYADLRPAPTVRVALADVRAGVMAFQYASPPAHPFVLAAWRATRTSSPDKAASAIRSAISGYYELVRPASALEVVDLAREEAPGLVGIPVHKWVFPWSERSIDENAKFRQVCLEEEGLANGTRISAADGLTLFGPVSERKLELETARLTKLVDSVAAKGFLADARRPLEVVGLRADGEYRWLVVQGQHRFAVCAAFGIRQTAVRVTRIIRREDAMHWPHVVWKTFTVGGATRLFDRIFSGEAPHCAKTWLAAHAERVTDAESGQHVGLKHKAHAL